jgi:hypothetical protein
VNASEVQADQNGGATEAPQKKGKAKRERRRRDYSGELAELQARVAAALKLLRRSASKDGAVTGELVGIAIETLTGE